MEMHNWIAFEIILNKNDRKMNKIKQKAMKKLHKIKCITELKRLDSDA